MVDGSATIKPRATARRSGVVVPRKLTWRHKLAAWSIVGLIRALSVTWRCRFVDLYGTFECEHERPMIFAFWHNRLALSTVMWRRWAIYNCPANGIVALISASHDGGILSDVLKFFGIEAVRGSSSRRGPQALLELTTWTERGYNVAITPDGPRGPKYQVRDGIISLAQVSGYEIQPVSTSVTRKVVVKSWDRFQIPLPFARCEVRFGKPLTVPRDATPEQREEIRKEIERRLLELTSD